MPRPGWLRAVPAGLTVAIFVSALSLAGSAGAQTATATREEFLGRIRAAESLAEEGSSAPSPEKMQSVIGALGLPLEISDTANHLVLPRDAYLDGLEGVSTEDFTHARSHLAALREAITSPPVTIDEGRVEETITTMYREDPGLDDGGFLAGLSRAVRRFFSRLGELISRPFRGGFRAGDGVAWLLLIAIFAGLLFLVWRLTRRFVPSLEEKETHAGGDLGPEGWRQMAEAALTRGDRREATRCLYRWLLADLAADGIVPDRVSLTAGETRMAVARRRPQLSDPVTKATKAFERIAFAGFEPTSADVDALRTAIQEVTHA